MNPVVRLDISTGESQVQAFIDKGKTFRQSFNAFHSLQGLGLLVEFLEVVQKEIGLKPPVILEAIWTLSKSSSPIFRGTWVFINYYQPFTFLQGEDFQV